MKRIALTLALGTALLALVGCMAGDAGAQAAQEKTPDMQPMTEEQQKPEIATGGGTGEDASLPTKGN